MKIYSEQPLSEFRFWSGGAEHASYLTDEELDRIESQLTAELYPKGLSDTELNDLFWFEFEFLCGLIGLNEEEVCEREIYKDRTRPR